MKQQKGVGVKKDSGTNKLISSEGVAPGAADDIKIGAPCYQQ